jgi:hypothetical protein
LRLELVALLALGACAPTRWEHPQLGTAAVEKDTRECAAQARSEWFRYDASYDLYRFCMRSKGYRRGTGALEHRGVAS